MTEEQFDELRRSAFAIAYRMLGSVSEAEDMVQEGFLRLYRAREGGERIESPRAYLSTVVSRLSLDHLRSARVRRETYVGEWLPEPLLASADDDPAHKVEIADSLSHAFLVLLESLSPEQRAAFLLHDVFDEPYDRIADIVGTSDQNARQLVTRARRHVEQRRWAGPVRGLARAPRGAGKPLLRRRRGRRPPRARGAAGPRRGAPRRRRRQGARPRACRSTAEAGWHGADGGVCAASTLLGDITSRREEVNGQPGALVFDREGRLISVVILDVADGQIQSVSSIVNPDKLQHLGPVADLGALLRERSAR